MSVSDLSVGSELLGYRVEGVLGRGGMGVVYLAEDLRLRRRVALKLLAAELAADEAFRRRFLEESELAASLDHPNVVPIYAAGEAGERLFIAMRYVEGRDLKELLRGGPLAPERAIDVCAQVAEALDFAHERGLVHRDVKPSNVLLDKREHVYLADFGLTKRLSEPRGVEPGLFGTIDYIAPEQIRGEQVDGRADEYALGCLLCECLTGDPPLRRATDAATLFAHLEEEPVAPPGLEGVVAKALAKEPEDRYDTCTELVDAAREALGLGRQASWWRLPVLVALLGVALVVAGVASYLALRSGGGAVAEAGADSLVRIDPTTNRVTQRMPVGRVASGVAADGGYVWVTSAGDGTVWRIDPRTHAVLKMAAHGTPTGIVLAGGEAVVGDGPEHTIATFDRATGALRYASVINGVQSYGALPVGAGPRGAWFGDPLAGIVGKVDDALISNGAPSAQVAIPVDHTNLNTVYEDFNGLAVGAGALWVAGDPFGRTVWRVDPATTRVVATIRLPFIPAAIAAGEGGVWVTSLLGDTVSRIDPTTDQIVSTIQVGRGPDAIATGDGGVWVTSTIDDSVWRIDPRTNRVAAKVPLPGAPGRIAVGAGGIWVTTSRPAQSAPRHAIKIGVLADCTGGFAIYHDQSLAGAELPLIERGGRPGAAVADGVRGVSVARRPISLYFGCDAAGSSYPTAVLAEARRLVEKDGVQVLIGPTQQDQEWVLQQYARQHPGTAFIGAVAADLFTHPAPNFFSFYPNGAQWIAGLGDYAYRKLGWRTAVTITDPATKYFGWAQSAGFTAEFCSLGGTILKRLWIPLAYFATPNVAGVVAKIPHRGVDGLFVAGEDATAIAVANGYAALRGNVSRRMIAGSAVTTPTLYRLGPRAAGLVTAGPMLDVSGGHPSPPSAGGYLTRFATAFPRIPPPAFAGLAGLGGQFDVPYYNAMVATLEALDRVRGDLSGGERRFMAALAKVTLDAPNGRTGLDSRHRAVAPNYVWQLQGPRLIPHIIRMIPNVDPTFGGYFKSTDPPPSEATPACRHGKPPPWTRSR